MSNNTIFDDVFRTMVEKMTYLIVPLINEVFHTSYPEDVEIVHLRNEHQLEDGELITDARFLIGDKVYHIECQSTDDTTMAIRMFEYDFAIAMESRWRAGRKFYVEFPRSCVIYLRSTKNTSDVEEVDEVMGGKVLQLESERLREEGMTIGEARGKAIGKAEGEARIRALINHLILDGRADEIQRIVNSEDACRELYRKYGL